MVSTDTRNNENLSTELTQQTVVCETKLSTAIPKGSSVPLEVKKQLKHQLEPVYESESSNSSSRVQSLENLSTFEEKVSSTSSPKKKSKTSKIKQAASQSSKKKEIASPSKKKSKKEQSQKVGKKTDNGADVINAEKKGGKKTDNGANISNAEKKDTMKIDHGAAVSNAEKKGGKKIDNGADVSNLKKTVASKPKDVRSSEEKVNETEEVKETESAMENVKHSEKKSSAIDISDSFERSKNVVKREKCEDEARKDNIKQADDTVEDVEKCDKTINVTVSMSELASLDVKDVTFHSETSRISQGTLLEKEVTPVIVSEVINPWCFYVQRYATALNGLTEEIWYVFN